MIYDPSFSRTFAGRPTRAVEITALIASHGESDACLEWPYKRRNNGYGVCCYKGREHRVHRIAFLIVHGELPDDMKVLHKCDNPPCFNPKHLFSGTQSDNMADCVAKGRHRFGINPNPPRGIPRPDQWGENSKKAKLTNAGVLAIRERYQNGSVSQQELAEEFNVSQILVSLIVRRRIWKHI